MTSGCVLVGEIGVWGRQFTDLIVDATRDPLAACRSFGLGAEVFRVEGFGGLVG